MQIKIEVLGDPAPQGSKRVFNGRVVEAAGEKLKRWRKAIAASCVAAREHNDVFFTGPVQVRVAFYLPRPKTISIDKRPTPIVPPDLDKLARGLLDGIGQSEMIWGDDSQVIELHATKHYADGREPGAVIEIFGS
jgi:Holliday junction resolvase RusA-like endonuclease